MKLGCTIIPFWSVGLKKIPSFRMLVAERRPESDGVHYVGWGRKRSANRAERLADLRNGSVLLLEEGVLRSVVHSDPSLSIILDNQGIFYDATVPSRLETLVSRDLSTGEVQRVRKLSERWQILRLSKYNGAREFSGELPERYVLVIDQTAGDLSIQYGLADASSFHRMLAAALAENPDAAVVVKMHPDIYTRKKAGHFDPAELRKNPRILVVAENCHPVRLIEQADVVYCVTSQVGFEALVWGKRVRCFGMPFYAGWGLTEDEQPAPGRRGSATLEQLVHATLVDYPRYVDPERNERCEVETVMAHIGLQRRMRARFPATIYALGFSRWKKPILQRFLQGSDVVFVGNAAKIPSHGMVALWGKARPDGIPTGAKILHVEDGFLRSSGLGGDLIQPLSWVFDDTGLYYDAAQPSGLENTLQTHEFDPALLDRARSLREKIVAEGVSKYNLSQAAWARPATAQQVVLVPGQVENDASIRYGAAGVSTNLGLLQAVRKKCPEAYLVYKPHPDVVAGLRRKGVGENEAAQWCDEIITDGDVVQLLGQVDELHVLTSLAGFEALLRGIPVTCHGQPFYAGWGLTTDLAPLARRTRRRTLDELVAGALILYPTYVSRVSNAFTTPERAVEELVEWRKTGVSQMPLQRRMLRKINQLWAASGLKRNA